MSVSLKKPITILMLFALFMMFMFTSPVFAEHNNSQDELKIDPFGISEGDTQADFETWFNKSLNWIIVITLGLAVLSGALLAMFLNVAIGQRSKETAKSWGGGIVIGLILISSVVTIVKIVYNALKF
ncbi:hypothetical protein L1765_10115 [Microaerobacter geothermalis]|uniref:hypothetical protein n=1 Tax=Microaerobacter geothermalis TaxID=674972 RepID=UPI001F4536FA|nr:hypothetical protein [Microaerobacter geothermalis]MCF6094317.1 hypothetical protein [Microaerobacter geothermalis]